MQPHKPEDDSREIRTPLDFAHFLMGAVVVVLFFISIAMIFISAPILIPIAIAAWLFYKWLP